MDKPLPLGLSYDMRIDENGAYCQSCRGLLKTPVNFIKTSARKTELQLEKIIGIEESVCPACILIKLAKYLQKHAKAVETDMEVINGIDNKLSDLKSPENDDLIAKYNELKDNAKELITAETNLMDEVSEFMTEIENSNYKYLIAPAEDLATAENFDGYNETKNTDSIEEPDDDL